MVQQLQLLHYPSLNRKGFAYWWSFGALRLISYFGFCPNFEVLRQLGFWTLKTTNKFIHCCQIGRTYDILWLKFISPKVWNVKFEQCCPAMKPEVAVHIFYILSSSLTLVVLTSVSNSRFVAKLQYSVWLFVIDVKGHDCNQRISN